VDHDVEALQANAIRVYRVASDSALPVKSEDVIRALPAAMVESRCEQEGGPAGFDH